MKHWLMWLGVLGQAWANPLRLLVSGIEVPEYVYVLNILFWAMIFGGCWLWTRQKSRHWVFVLWGLIAPIGFLGIALLKDKS